MAPSLKILFGSRWRARGLATAIEAIDVGALAGEYLVLRDPQARRDHQLPARRSDAGKRCFVGHAGIPSSRGASNRLEEHYAIALVNLHWRWPRPGGGWFRLLDYQVPLKARRPDPDVGKIDILGVTDEGRLVIVELKVMGLTGCRSDAPPHALMEGLTYAALVEADPDAIAQEANRRYGVDVARTTVPGASGMVAQLTALRAAGGWGSSFTRPMESIEGRHRGARRLRRAR